MPLIKSLRAILMVRKLREDAEERALAGISQEILRWQSHVEKLRSGLAEITSARLREIQCIADAAHHRSSEACYRALLQQCVEAENKVERLKAARAERMATYMAARLARQVAEELEGQRRAAHQAEIVLREQKWNEDMFLARRVSNSNRIISSERSLESKESA